MAGRIIGLVGPIASGKTAAAKALIGAGFERFSLSGFVQRAAGTLPTDEHGVRQGIDLINVQGRARRYLPLTSEEYGRMRRVEDYTAAGLSFRREYNPAYFAKAVTQQIRRRWEDGRLSRDADIVIEGIRTPEEIMYLQEALGMYAIGVTTGTRDDMTAGQAERWERVLRREREEHRQGEPETPEQFVEIDNYELGEGFHIWDALQLCAQEGSLIVNAGKPVQYTRREVLAIARGLSNIEGQTRSAERAAY